MYVCICKAITDQQIIQQLDRGARNFKDVSKQLGVGTQCGICCRRTQSLIKDYQLAKTHLSLAYAAG